MTYRLLVMTIIEPEIMKNVALSISLDSTTMTTLNRLCKFGIYHIFFSTGRKCFDILFKTNIFYVCSFV